jgi:hypothetical protein
LAEIMIAGMRKNFIIFAIVLFVPGLFFALSTDNVFFTGMNHAFDQWILEHHPIDAMINKNLAEGYTQRYVNELIRRGQKDTEVVKALEDASSSSNLSIASQTTYALYRLNNNPDERVKALIEMFKKDPKDGTISRIIAFNFTQADAKYIYLLEPLLNSDNPDIVEMAKMKIDDLNGVE